MISIIVTTAWITMFSTVNVEGTSDEICPDGWHYYQPRQRCFLLEPKNPLIWTQARSRCQDYGGHLTTIRDAQTNAFLNDLIFPSCDEYWIGLHDMSTEGVFQWLDDPNRANFTNWAPGEPNSNGYEDCVCISAKRNSQWNDAFCGIYLGYSCERAARNNHAPTVTTPVKPRLVTSPVADTSTTPPVVDTSTTPPVADTSTTPPVVDTSTTSPVIDTLTTPEIVGSCPRTGGWTYYHPRHRCFRFETNYFTWTQARTRCGGFEATLATIPDFHTKEFLRDLVDKFMYDKYWIGLHKKNSRNFYQWLDTDKKANFTHWGDGMPPDNLNGAEGCVFMQPGPQGQWFVSECTSRLGLICETAAMLHGTDV